MCVCVPPSPAPRARCQGRGGGSPQCPKASREAAPSAAGEAGVPGVPPAGCPRPCSGESSAVTQLLLPALLHSLANISSHFLLHVPPPFPTFTIGSLLCHSHLPPSSFAFTVHLVFPSFQPLSLFSVFSLSSQDCSSLFYMFFLRILLTVTQCPAIFTNFTFPLCNCLHFAS